MVVGMSMVAPDFGEDHEHGKSAMKGELYGSQARVISANCRFSTVRWFRMIAGRSSGRSEWLRIGKLGCARHHEHETWNNREPKEPVPDRLLGNRRYISVGSGWKLPDHECRKCRLPA